MTTRSDKMRCPYPDCPQQQETSRGEEGDRCEHLADEIYLCHDCGRLCYRCVKGNCQTLNRPFSNFCRRCGECQFLKSRQLTAASRWEAVRQFDYDWQFCRAAEGGPAALPEPETVVAFSDSLPGFRPPEVLLEMRFIDGLLAVHQGGGFLALIHPFGDLAENLSRSPVVWSEGEAAILWNQCHVELPGSAYTAESFRPYPPTWTPDRRYTIFSTPYAAFVVELGSLSGWHVQSEARVAVVGPWTHQSSARLAAGPIPLTLQHHPSHPTRPTNLEVQPNRIGLLFRDSNNRYSWSVVNLDNVFSGQVTDSHLDSACALGIEGAPVQILNLRNHALIFATPQGHWIWPFSDAVEQRNDQLWSLETPVWSLETPASDGSELILDQQVANRNFFSWRCQHLLFDDATNQPNTAEENVELCYSRQNGSEPIAETCDVWLNQKNRTQQSSPIPCQTGRSERPIGAFKSTDGIRYMLFLVNSHGEFFQKAVSQNRPQRLSNLQAGAVSEIHGLQFYDPLLVIVRDDVQTENCDRIEVRSICYPEEPMVIRGVQLRADPVPWSQFLFTCETEQNRLLLKRRKLPVVSHGTNKHINEPTHKFM